MATRTKVNNFSSSIDTNFQTYINSRPCKWHYLFQTLNISLNTTALHKLWPVITYSVIWYQRHQINERRATYMGDYSSCNGGYALFKNMRKRWLLPGRLLKCLTLFISLKCLNYLFHKNVVKNTDSFIFLLDIGVIDSFDSENYLCFLVKLFYRL